MAPRAISSGTISFGLVSIPVKIYTATSPKKVRFNLLEAETGARPKQQYVSSVSGEPLERSELVKGYEYSRGQYVKLSEEELKALEADRTGAMDISEFVPLEDIDMVQIERSYYLGPDKGGVKAYHLLAESMRRKDVVAVARWQARGKEQLTLVRPYREGLILHQLFYADEVRAFGEIDVGAEPKLDQAELDLAEKLIDQLVSEQFDPDGYTDTYTERVRGLIEQKVAGEEITVAPEEPKAQIIDLFEALKQSLDEGEEKGKDQKKTGSDEKAGSDTKGEAKTKAAGGKKAEPKPPKKAVPRKKKSKKKTGSE